MSASGQFSETPSGLVRLGAPKALGYFMVHPLINEFLATNSGVNVMLRLEDRYMDLIDEEIDLAIRITNEPPRGLSASGCLRSVIFYVPRRSIWRNMALRLIRRS